MQKAEAFLAEIYRVEGPNQQPLILNVFSKYRKVKDLRVKRPMAICFIYGKGKPQVSDPFSLGLRGSVVAQ